MSRFDVDRFENPPDAELVCCICQGVLDQPKETPCRHVFCKVCIETWLEKHRTCPTCRGTTRKDQLQNVLPLLQNMINRLKLRCGNFANGCTESWTTEQYNAKHDDECSFKKVQCRHRLCTKEVIKKYLAKHESVCEFAEGLCPKFCGLMVFVKKMRTHSCLEELKAKVKEQGGVIDTQKQRIQELEDEAKTLREQLQQQDDWGDDDYYSEDDNAWESWSADSNPTHSNASNDNDSMVGFSENSDVYDPWSPIFALRRGLDAMYRATPPASPERTPSYNDSSSPRVQNNSSAAAAASDHNYYSCDDVRSNASHYSLSDNQYSNYASGESEVDRSSQYDQNSQTGSFSWRSGSRTPDGSDDQDQGTDATGSMSGSRSSVNSDEDRNSCRQSDSNSDNESNSSGSRVPTHGKFSHVNTSDSSESDSESTHDSKSGKSKSVAVLPLQCVSDDQVTSSGLVEYPTEDTSSCSPHQKRKRKRKYGLGHGSDSDDGARQGPRKRSRRSASSDQTDGSLPRPAASRSDHSVSDATSDDSTPKVRRTNRRLLISDSSDSDAANKFPSDEHMTDEFSDSD